MDGSDESMPPDGEDELQLPDEDESMSPAEDVDASTEAPSSTLDTEWTLSNTLKATTSSCTQLRSQAQFFPGSSSPHPTARTARIAHSSTRRKRRSVSPLKTN